MWKAAKLSMGKVKVESYSVLPKPDMWLFVSLCELGLFQLICQLLLAKYHSPFGKLKLCYVPLRLRIGCF